MHSYCHIIFLLLQLGSLCLAKSGSKRDLKKYPIPIPLKPYPVVTPNSYRSDNAWGEIRTASHSEDQFRVEVQKEDGSRQGVSVYRSPDGSIQRQYYEAGAHGYRVKRENPFIKSAPKKLESTTDSEKKETVKTVQENNDEQSKLKTIVSDPTMVSPEVSGSFRMSVREHVPSPAKMAAGLVRKQAFEAGAKKHLLETNDKEEPSESLQNYESILSAIRPQETFLDKLFPLHTPPTQVSISRPQSIAVAGPSADSEASTSGTALAGPGSVAVAAPESIAIAGPGGFAFSSATGISSVDTNFNNDNVQTTNSIQGSTPIVIDAPKDKGQNNGQLLIKRPQPSVRRSTTILQRPRMWAPQLSQSSVLNTVTRDEYHRFGDVFRTFNNALIRQRGSPTTANGLRPNLVFDNGKTVIAHPNANFATFYHHHIQPSFTFQKHGTPFFYYFQY